MSGAARCAFPQGGNPISASKLIVFTYPDSGGEVAPVVTDLLTILGFAISEVGGASAAKVRFHDGKDATGPAISPLINVAANGFQQVLSWPNGVECLSGSVFAEYSGAGSLEIVVYW